VLLAKLHLQIHGVITWKIAVC